MTITVRIPPAFIPQALFVGWPWRAALLEDALRLHVLRNRRRGVVYVDPNVRLI